MFAMNVAGAEVRGVSIMYAMTVGNVDAMASVMIDPDADLDLNVRYITSKD